MKRLNCYLWEIVAGYSTPATFRELNKIPEISANLDTFNLQKFMKSDIPVNKLSLVDDRDIIIDRVMQENNPHDIKFAWSILPSKYKDQYVNIVKSKIKNIKNDIDSDIENIIIKELENFPNNNIYWQNERYKLISKYLIKNKPIVSFVLLDILPLMSRFVDIILFNTVNLDFWKNVLNTSYLEKNIKKYLKLKNMSKYNIDLLLHLDMFVYENNIKDIYKPTKHHIHLH